MNLVLWLKPQHFQDFQFLLHDHLLALMELRFGLFDQMELATGKFPYEEWKTPFDQIKQVVQGDPPRLSTESFPTEFCDFIEKW